MKICHVCGIECDDNAEVCLVCGADLTDNETLDEAVLSNVINEPVLLASFDDIVNTEIFMDILAQNKIPCTKGNDVLGVKVIFGGGFVADEIYVDKCDFKKAEALYNEFMENPPEFDGDFFEEDYEE